MASRVEQVSSVTSANDVLSKLSIDANNRQACSQNKAYYRISRTAAAGSTTFTAFLPLRPPCTYRMNINWQANSSNGGVIVIQYLVQVNQAVSGGGIGQGSVSPLVSQTAAGNVITLTKNATSDTLDVTVNNTPTGGTITETIEFEIISNKNF